MIGIVSEDDQPQEVIPCEDGEKGKDETVQGSTIGMAQLRKKTHYYEKQQQLELVLAAQQLLEEENMIFNLKILMRMRNMKQTQEAVTYGKMSTVWNCCKEEYYLTLLIIWNQKGRGRGCSIIIGRGSHCTSRDCWCQDQQIAWDWWFRCMRTWDILEKNGFWLRCA
jgi:hypothetical protein